MRRKVRPEEITPISVSNVKKKGFFAFKGHPLLIFGAGPSFGALDAMRFNVNVFALNHTITELYEHPKHWWVSNDHDRTFQSKHIIDGIRPKIKDYSPWFTITQQIFVPGRLGSISFFDHHGAKHIPEAWRLPAPDGSKIIYYNAGKGNDQENGNFIYNHLTVLDVALELATMWECSPIILVGCDMTMKRPSEYYHEKFRWKDTPRKIAHGKLDEARESIERNRKRWSDDIWIVDGLWNNPPFSRISASDVTSHLESYLLEKNSGEESSEEPFAMGQNSARCASGKVPR